MTAIRLTANGTVEVLRDGAVVGNLEMAHVCALDSDLRDCVGKAQECRGEAIPVPTKSFARGVRPRNYAVGVRM